MVFSALACFTITDLTNAANSIFSCNLKVVHVASMKRFHFIYNSRNFQHVLFASYIHVHMYGSSLLFTLLYFGGIYWLQKLVQCKC